MTDTGRLEAFSDGVIAIIITIMMLEMNAPHEANLAALLPLWPVFLSYILSFAYIGIYWNNHHYMINARKKVSGGIHGSRAYSTRITQKTVSRGRHVDRYLACPSFPVSDK